MACCRFIFQETKAKYRELIQPYAGLRYAFHAILVVIVLFYRNAYIQESNTKSSTQDNTDITQNLYPSQEGANYSRATSVQADVQKMAVKGAQVVSNSTHTAIYPSSTPTPTLDPDPIVTCNFKYVGAKQIRKNECSKSFECQIGQQWYIYTSRDKCTQDQKNQYDNNNNYQPNPTYPPCTVYYSALGYSQTYSYTSPEQCSKLQQESAVPTSDPDPYVTCQSKGEDIVLKRSVCSSLVDCQIGSEYFLLPSADCTRLQQQYVEEQSNQSNQTNNEMNKQNNSQCKAYAERWYVNQYSQYGSGEAGKAVFEINAPKYKQMIEDCNRQFPL